MKPGTLDQAMVAAARFLREARALRKARKEPGTHPREAGATRRASMDLTRTLADLRQGR